MLIISYHVSNKARIWLIRLPILIVYSLFTIRWVFSSYVVFSFRIILYSFRGEGLALFVTSGS